MRRHPTFRYMVVVDDHWYTNAGWVNAADYNSPNIRHWSTYQRVPTFKKALKVVVKLCDAGLPARLEVDKKMWARKSARRKQWCGYKTLTLISEVTAQ